VPSVGTRNRRKKWRPGLVAKCAGGKSADQQTSPVRKAESHIYSCDNLWIPLTQLAPTS